MSGLGVNTDKSLMLSGKGAPQQDLRALAAEMGQWRQAPQAGVHLIAISLSSCVPAKSRSKELIDTLTDALSLFAERRHAPFYKVTSADFALLVKASDVAALSMVRDAKIEALRSIERVLPGSFGTIDQGRLVLSYDLAADYRSAAQRVARFTEIANEEAAAAAADDGAAPQRRGLTETDIKKVMTAFEKFGSEKFVKAFVRAQNVGRPTQDGFASNLTEFYFSIDLIRKPLFVDVDMRGSGKLFQEFTQSLDQIMLGSIALLPSVDGVWSINLNVETVFTETFETFLRELSEDRATRLCLEFRQANIIENFDEYEVALGVIKARGAKIIVDQIFPAAAGLVDLSHLGASYCKIHWQDGGEDTLRDRAKAIKYIKACDITPVLSRCDCDHAVEVGKELGIELFQGFHVDGHLDSRLAA
ncbi:MAG: hypothetical protein SFV19_02815 [Rhodospirillaceae bacterium]|nr:hypothetical protein [Rhodospirillaceae bacterium]